MIQDRTSVNKGDRIITQKRLKAQTCKQRTKAADIFKSALLKHCESVNDLVLYIFLQIIPYSTERKQKEEKVLGKNLL